MTVMSKNVVDTQASNEGSNATMAEVTHPSQASTAAQAMSHIMSR